MNFCHGSESTLISPEFGDFCSPDGKEFNRNKSAVVIPQSDSKEITDFTSDMTRHQQSTTTFYESAPVVVGEQTQPTAHVSTYIEQLADIKAFLAKPYLLASGSWSTTDIAGAVLAYGDIGPYLSSIPLWADKVSGFNLVRGDFIVRVEINASPFQQGKLLTHYVPCYSNFVALNAKFGKRVNNSLTSKVQHPHVELNCDKASVSLRIPYISPSHFYGKKEGYYDWGRWFLEVYSALKTGTAAPASQMVVDYLVYGYFENIELAAPCVPQSGKREMKLNRNRVIESEENKGPIEEGLRKVGATAKILDDVPLLSEFSKPVSWASDILAKMAHVWGWSKPRELNGVTVFSEQIGRYAGTADGPSLAMPGGVKADNSLTTIDYASYTNEDEMSLPYLFKIPYYDSELTWTSDMGQGYSLLDTYICPQNMYQSYTDTVGAKTVIYHQYAPLGYMSQFFRFWRGGIELTLKFVKTRMHSGKLQVVFTPVTTVSTGATLTNAAYALRALVDVKTEDEITLTLPFLAFTDYLSTGTTGGPALPKYSGRLQIQVLNDLRAPESCSQSIGIQVFYRGAPDFEYSVPCNNTKAAIPYIPQSGKGEIMHGRETGIEIARDVIGGMEVKHDEVMHAERCVGEKVLSIKQLLLRNSPMWPIKYGFMWNAGSTAFGFLPHFLPAAQLKAGTGDMNVPTFGGDMMGMLVPMYAFFRGSVNWYVRDAEEPDTGSVVYRFGNIPGAINGSNALADVYARLTLAPKNLIPDVSTTSSVNTDAPILGLTTVPAMPTNFVETRNLAYQHIPYYNALPLTLTAQYTGAEQINDPSIPYGTFVLFTGGTSGIPLVQRAVGDDFRCHFFMGCPPIPYSSV